MKQNQRRDDPARNPDPITKAPGSHPVGTGVGAAVGGAAGIAGAVAAGAAIGTAVGPVGTAVGAIAGAVAGGLAGKGAAEEINPTFEHDYWRKNYVRRPYVASGASYDHYAPAYQYGWESQQKHAGRTFDEVEPDLAGEWENVKGKSPLDWDAARQASRDAWDRTSSDDRR